MQISGNSILQILIKNYLIIFHQPLIDRRAIIRTRTEMDGIYVRDQLSDAEYFGRHAREKVNIGEYEQGMDFLCKAVQIAPHHIHSLMEIGNCYEYLNQSDKAIVCYEKVIQIDPFPAEAWFNKGRRIKNIGDKKEVTQCTQRATELCCGR
jgi:tetratricopeptide (TPR) repeat protein